MPGAGCGQAGVWSGQTQRSESSLFVVLGLIIFWRAGQERLYPRGCRHLLFLCFACVGVLCRECKQVDARATCVWCRRRGRTSLGDLYNRPACGQAAPCGRRPLISHLGRHALGTGHLGGRIEYMRRPSTQRLASASRRARWTTRKGNCSRSHSYIRISGSSSSRSRTRYVW